MSTTPTSRMSQVGAVSDSLLFSKYSAVNDSLLLSKYASRHYPAVLCCDCMGQVLDISSNCLQVPCDLRLCQSGVLHAVAGLPSSHPHTARMA